MLGGTEVTDFGCAVTLLIPGENAKSLWIRYYPNNVSRNRSHINFKCKWVLIYRKASLIHEVGGLSDAQTQQSTAKQQSILPKAGFYKSTKL